MRNVAAIDLLKENGIKPTSQRVLILEYLQNSYEHPSTEDIYEDLQGEIAILSRATVYNTVNVLREKGIIKALDLGSEVLRYDIDTNEHAHYRCKKCGKLWNVDYDDSAFTSLLEGFRVEEKQVIIHGVCQDCQREE